MDWFGSTKWYENNGLLLQEKIMFSGVPERRFDSKPSGQYLMMREYFLN
jgi:hypothetical protein